MYEKETIQNFPAEPHLFCTHTYLSLRIFFYFIAGRLLSLKKEFQNNQLKKQTCSEFLKMVKKIVL